MSKLKITDVQVDCRELTQEQINKMYDIIKKRGYGLYHDMSITEKFYMLRRNAIEETQFITDIKYTHFKVVSYDEFITLFDKPKFKPKKAIKELEQRIALLEQKLSEKDAENSVNEAVEELPIVIKKGMRFRHHITGGIYEIEGVSDEKVYVYTSDKQNAIEYEFNNVMDYFNRGHWILLPPTEKKESELTKGAICKFWDNDENSYEIGRYEPVSYISSSSITHKHVNMLTLESFKNAKVISIDEALQLFKKQLLNEN